LATNKKSKKTINWNFNICTKMEIKHDARVINIHGGLDGQLTNSLLITCPIEVQLVVFAPYMFGKP
jgi:hypothetical protein